MVPVDAGDASDAEELPCGPEYCQCEGARADVDGDGERAPWCAGEDCEPDDPAIHPGALDEVGDGVDQNCDGADGVDADRDGHAALELGGDDCDDTDAARHPGASDGESWSVRTVQSDVGHPDLGWTLDAAMVEGDLRIAYLALTDWNGATPAFGELRYAAGVLDGPATIERLAEGRSVEVFMDGGASSVVAYLLHDEPEVHVTIEADGWRNDVIGLAYVLSGVVTDVSGAIHVIYSDDDLRLVHTFSAEGWQSEEITKDGYMASVGLDNRGALHVVYACCWDDDASRSVLRYATNARGSWSTEMIAVSTAGPWSDLAVTTGDAVYIAYEYSQPEWGESEIRFATNESGDWVVQTIAERDWNMAPSLAVGEDGAVHLAFWRLGSVADSDPPEERSQILYAVRVGGEWGTELVDPDGGYLPAIVLDGDGQPVIAYRWGPNRRAPPAWQIGAIRVAVRGALQDGLDQDCDGTDG